MASEDWVIDLPSDSGQILSPLWASISPFVKWQLTPGLF